MHGQLVDWKLSPDPSRRGDLKCLQTPYEQMGSAMPDFGDQSGEPLDELLDLASVRKATSLSRSGIYRSMSQGEFPKAIKLTAGRVAWRKSQIRQWLSAKVADQSHSI